MKKIFNRSPKASKDYTPSMLPQTRREVFFDTLKLNWKSFLLYGLLLLAFTLPMHIVTLSESMAVINLQNLDSDIAKTPYMISMTRLISSFIKLPCFLLLAVVVSGFARVIRQYAWMENVNFTYDFKQGVKNNVGHLLLLAVLVGIVNIVAVFFSSVAETTADLFSSIIVLLPTAIIILYLLPVFAYMVVSISIYSQKFGTHFRLGKLLYFQAPWKTLIALLCCFAPFILQAVPVFIFQIIGAVLSSMLIPVVFLGWYLFTLDGLDQSVNRQNYPSLVGRGLYNPQSKQ